MKHSLAKKLMELGFWIVVTVIFLYDRTYLIQKVGLGHFAECIFIRLSLIISLAYLNNHYLIPEYFVNNRYFLYFSSLMLILATYISLQSLYDIYLYGFVIGALNHRNF